MSRLIRPIEYAPNPRLYRGASARRTSEAALRMKTREDIERIVALRQKLFNIVVRGIVDNLIVGVVFGGVLPLWVFWGQSPNALAPGIDATRLAPSWVSLIGYGVAAVLMFVVMIMVLRLDKAAEQRDDLTVTGSETRQLVGVSGGGTVYKLSSLDEVETDIERFQTLIIISGGIGMVVAIFVIVWIFAVPANFQSLDIGCPPGPGDAADICPCWTQPGNLTAPSMLHLIVAIASLVNNALMLVSASQTVGNALKSIEGVRPMAQSRHTEMSELMTQAEDGTWIMNSAIPGGCDT